MKQSIVPLDLSVSEHDRPAATPIARLARKLLLRQFEKLRHGRLSLIDGALQASFGAPDATVPIAVTLKVRDPRFYGDVLFAGTLGAGESYTEGRWDCDDLTGLVRIMVANRHLLEDVDAGWTRLTAPLFKVGHWLNGNSREGSRRNIAAHYDLGNRFFELFLDETMAYSCAIFPTPDTPLREASIAKFDAALSKLDLKPGQHLLEIGTGWGGLALHAARRYGCRVTTTTISKEQYELARERVAREGLADRITLLLEDYRDLKGTYDALVSIEMVEAVGARYLETYLAKCSRLLESSGAMLLQSITIRDQLYDYALRSVDFIKRCIFPGSFIPSVRTLVDAVARATDLKLTHLEDIGPHYAQTLRLWRERLLAHAGEVRAQGYPERLVRLWEFYLSYCEGGFEERQLGDVQMLLVKPRSRRPALATIHAAPA
jgi:cyclopropane-fatty-acyl-phospholipid synthase